jgi:hypothetical protein
MDKQIDSSELYASDIADTGNIFHYRSISKAALAGIIFSITGFLFFISSLLIVLPLAGFALCLIGLSSIKRLPEELSGKSVAKTGLILSGVTLLIGSALHGYTIATEVPEGYERISYRMLKDDPKTLLEYSEKAEELDGKKVFLKGWIRPGNRTNNLKDFILVGDFGSCCFGGSPKITDVVAISILGDERVSYGWKMRKIAGTFRLNRKKASTTEEGVPSVYYQIDADIVK